MLDEALREQMTGATVKLIRAIHYVNAGTAEFLLGPERNFYFLEVNARIQVEHPVTELVTGTDLVQEQFRVAAGLPLSFTQEQIVLRGAAIECRISAEDPENRFLPATGTVQALQEPSGPGVRLDSGLYAGLQVPLFYDPLLVETDCMGQRPATSHCSYGPRPRGIPYSGCAHHTAFCTLADGATALYRG